MHVPNQFITSFVLNVHCAYSLYRRTSHYQHASPPNSFHVDRASSEDPLVEAVWYIAAGAQVIQSGSVAAAVRGVPHVGARERTTAPARRARARHVVVIRAALCGVEAVSFDRLGKELIGSEVTTRAS